MMPAGKIFPTQRLYLCVYLNFQFASLFFSANPLYCICYIYFQRAVSMQEKILLNAREQKYAATNHLIPDMPVLLSDDVDIDRRV